MTVMAMIREDESSEHRPTAESDAALLARFATTGDRVALEAVLGRHLDAAYRFASRFCGGATDVDDVIQDACLRVMRNAAGYRGEGSVRSWFLTIVAHAAASRARGESRRRRYESAVLPAIGGGAAATADDEVQLTVRRVLAVLPECERAVVCLHYLEAQPFAAVAATLGISEGAARMQAHRGLERVRERLARRGLAADGIALAALLPVRAESAPEHVAARVHVLAASGAPAAPVAALAIGGACAATILAGAITWLRWTSAPEPPPAAAAQSSGRGSAGAVVAIVPTGELLDDPIAWKRYGTQPAAATLTRASAALSPTTNATCGLCSRRPMDLAAGPVAIELDVRLPARGKYRFSVAARDVDEPWSDSTPGPARNGGAMVVFNHGAIDPAPLMPAVGRFIAAELAPHDGRWGVIPLPPTGPAGPLLNDLQVEPGLHHVRLAVSAKRVEARVDGTGLYAGPFVFGGDLARAVFSFEVGTGTGDDARGDQIVVSDVSLGPATLATANPPEQPPTL